MKVTPRTARSLAGLLFGAFALTLTLTGCASEPAPPVETTEPAKPSPEPTTEPTETPEAWDRFTDERFPDSFELPPGWAAVERPDASTDLGVYQIDLMGPDGLPRLYFSTKVLGLGGACPPDFEALNIEELDAEPLNLAGYVAPTEPPEGLEIVDPHFVYRVSQFEGRVIASVAITNDVPSDFCRYYNLLRMDSRIVLFADQLQVPNYAPNMVPQREFATMDDARAFMDTEEYATLKRILTSYQLQ